MYFDTHAHYDDEAFDGDREQILAAALESGVELIVNAASDGKSSLSGIALSERYPHVYAAVGWHPHEARTFAEDSPKLIENWCRHSKVVAVGEIGLDYFYDLSERDVQRAVFERQMELAIQLNLPVIVHDRDAHGDCLEIVRRFPEVRGVFHCYSGSEEMAAELLKLGWYLGFGGSVTFKNAKKTPEVAAMCPIERLLLETDCPYLTPVPFRGRRNDSSYLPYVAEKIAELRGLTPREVAEAAMNNGKTLFGIE